jgi:hypothetical protein
MIKPEDYKIEYGIPHVTDEQVSLAHTEAELKRFRKFMYCQTMIVRPDGIPGIYAWDYERWLATNMDDKQGLDWD